MTSFAPSIRADAIASKDTAQSFDEDDVTVDGGAAVAVGPANAGTTSDAGADDTTSARSGLRGATVTPNTTLTGVEITLFASTVNLSRARLVRSDETVLDEKTGAFGGGSTITLRGVLVPDVEHYILLDNQGSGYTEAYNSTDSTPYTSTDVDLTGGAYITGNGNYGNIATPRLVRQVTALAGPPGHLELRDGETSGKAYVEWSEPADVFAWDVLSFSRTLDGETADVYIESSSDGGATWSEVAGPVGRNDSIPVTDDKRMRFRVDFFRANMASNPTIDSLARRYLL